MDAVTEIDFADAMLVTFEEMAALARLTGTAAPPYAAYTEDDVNEAAVDVGIRSLLARKWLTVATDRSGTRLADGLAEIVRALGEGTRFVMLARAGSGGQDRRGRLVFLDEMRVVVEEVVYPGLVALTMIDAGRTADFVCAVFDLDGSSEGEADVGDSVLARIPDGDRPVGASGWQDATLNVVLVVGAAAAVGVQWVEEGDDRRLWLLDVGEATRPSDGVPATPCPSAHLRERLSEVLAPLWRNRTMGEAGDL